MEINLTRVTSPDGVPDGPHFALLVYNTESITIPGDERSRTNPGHGYPERTETRLTITHYVTTDVKDVERAVRQIEENRLKYPYDKNPFVVLKVQGRVGVTTKTELTVP